MTIQEIAQEVTARLGREITLEFVRGALGPYERPSFDEDYIAASLSCQIATTWPSR
jgi:hypothetical protein